MFALLGMYPYDPQAILCTFAAAVLLAIGLLLGARASRLRFLRGVLTGLAVVVFLIAIALLLLPNLCRVREPAARVLTQNRLKQILLAFQNYHDGEGRNHLPDDIRDREGTPLLSWRVAILPYIEQEQLYKEFKLDEPWDSAHNIKLLEKMPKEYVPALAKVEPGHTFFQCFKGPRAAFRPGKPRTWAGYDFPDGMSNTLVIAEGGEAVPWTKPADLDFDPDKPLPALGGAFEDYINVALADGSTRSFQKAKIHWDRLPAWITPDGGEEHLPLDD
jgi:Protein of unknown function (DUF1559)